MVVISPTWLLGRCPQRRTPRRLWRNAVCSAWLSKIWILASRTPGPPPTLALRRGMSTAISKRISPGRRIRHISYSELRKGGCTILPYPRGNRGQQFRVRANCSREGRSLSTRYGMISQGILFAMVPDGKGPGPAFEQLDPKTGASVRIIAWGMKAGSTSYVYGPGDLPLVEGPGSDRNSRPGIRVLDLDTGKPTEVARCPRLEGRGMSRTASGPGARVAGPPLPALPALPCPRIPNVGAPRRHERLGALHWANTGPTAPCPGRSQRGTRLTTP